jgi:CCR4-NOT transcription complex subunit 9
LAAFGVIGSLSKCDHPDVVNYLLNNEFHPLRLNVLKFCVGISRAVSLFILQRLANHPDGHREIIQRPKRHQNCV